jgi:hypothetical protein
MMTRMTSIFCDAPENWGYGFQDVASPTMYGLIELHDHVSFYLVLILVVVSWFLVRGIFISHAISYARHSHGHIIEFF